MACYLKIYSAFLKCSAKSVSQVACQDPSETDGLEDISDDQQAEHDAMLLECAGEIVPSLAKAVPGNQFTPYFAGILPLFVPKTVSKLLKLFEIIGIVGISVMVLLLFSAGKSHCG